MTKNIVTEEWESEGRFGDTPEVTAANRKASDTTLAEDIREGFRYAALGNLGQAKYSLEASASNLRSIFGGIEHEDLTRAAWDLNAIANTLETLAKQVQKLTNKTVDKLNQLS